MQPKFDKNQKNFKILILSLGCNGMVKKPSHATVPLKVMFSQMDLAEIKLI
jgi:hypothetical protein